ncbi:AI-2E family transporter [Aliivibrio fischeri]|uniref:AI-2E family transporter n=1 Tax=Aliivibrio fischeri TaxID=668 RepID=UPI00084CCE0B|nr:AI-2E family transporter [Aliivibrio fischeri]OED52822.1 AI-2E family transporter [Aliivibrio fischeri]
MKLDHNFSNQAIDAFIKISALSVLVLWCFSILKPFLLLMVWGGIIATALYPIVAFFSKKTALSESKVSIILTVIGVLLLLIPLIALSTGIYTSGTELFLGYQDGSIAIPKPKERMQDWPIIGHEAYSFMSLASSNLESLLFKYSTEVKVVAAKAASLVGSLGGGFIQFIVSTIIAGVFMANASKCERAFILITNRLTGKHGEELIKLSKVTIRSVVQGVIGVAVIQATMAGLGMAVVGISASVLGLWVFLVLVFAIIQLPPILILLPIIFYVFSVDTTTTGVLFAIWCVLVSSSDAILKPILLSRGSHIPIIVILLGALGGMAMSGIVGLFVGAVVLSLTYQMFTVWLKNEAEETQNAKDNR